MIILIRIRWKLSFGLRLVKIDGVKIIRIKARVNIENDSKKNYLKFVYCRDRSIFYDYF